MEEGGIAISRQTHAEHRVASMYCIVPVHISPVFTTYRITTTYRVACCPCFFSQSKKRSTSRNTRLTTTLGVYMRATACMVACAPPQACFALAAQARTLSRSGCWMDEGSPKRSRTEQRRRCSYHRSLELSSLLSVASLGCHGTWPIELVAKLGLRPPLIF